MAYSVVFTPEARAQLIALFRYIEIDASLRSHNGSPMRSSTTASAFENCPRVRFAATIYAEAFTSPTIAAAWSIAFAVEGSEVWIIGVFYAGQDYEAILQSES